MIEQLLTSTLITAIKELYEQEVAAGLIQLQKTRPEFDGDLTVVVFPLLRISRKGPEQTAEELGKQRQTYHQAEASLQRDAFRWTGLFDRMEKLLPDGVSLRSFNPDYAKNSLSILGVARTLTQLQTLLDNLQNAQFQQMYLEN